MKRGVLVFDCFDTKELLADIFTEALDTKLYGFLRIHLVRQRSSIIMVYGL